MLARDPLAPIWCWRPTHRSGGARRCPTPAGRDTLHPGFGPCVTHEPTLMRRAWRRAMTISTELRVSPWEGLLLATALAGEHVARTERDLRSARAEHDGDPVHPAVLRLQAESRAERRILAQTSKTALDAGFTERLVQQAELNGRVLADALSAALRAIGASPDAELVAIEAAHAHLARAAASDPDATDDGPTGDAQAG